MTRLLTLVLVITWGCTAGQSKAPPESKEVSQKESKSGDQKKDVAPAKKTTPASAKRTPPPKKTLAKGKSGRPPIKWQDDLTWLSWEDARAKSAAEGKSICLVLYADWCPRCRELAPIFSDPEVAKLAKGLIMVRQDQDARPGWLQQFSDLGGYVPRIFFFGTDGNLRQDIKSPHPRYPYFYTPRGADALKRSMRAALGG